MTLLTDKGQESEMYREFLIIDIKQMGKECEQEIHRSRNMNGPTIPSTSLVTDTRKSPWKWKRFSDTAILLRDLKLRRGWSWGSWVGHVLACVRPWVLSPALPKTNRQANSEPSDCSIPWRPDSFSHITVPARTFQIQQKIPTL